MREAAVPREPALPGSPHPWPSRQRDGPRQGTPSWPARESPQTAETTSTRTDARRRRKSHIATGVGFFDHMLTLLAKHAAMDLTVQAAGDLAGRSAPHGRGRGHLPGHGHATRRWATGPASAATATSPCRWTRRWPPAPSTWAGRPTSSATPSFPRAKIGQFDSELVADFWQAVAANARCNLHVLVHYGRNGHHIAEGIFKAAARALRMAVEPDPRITGVPSTKGTLGG